MADKHNKVIGDEAKIIFADRMAKGQCSICGQELGKDRELVTDVNYGEIFVCAHHIRNKPKLGVDIKKEDVAVNET